ncbi:MAG: amino acid ABC transporter substrate-binding protein [Desulfobacterales bacterium]|nr:amino acid ABC transporter substrate-binding protein [Desulfobacterales bacterium]
MKKIKFYCRIILRFGIIFAYSSLSAETILKLATVDNFPPFAFIDNGKLTGVAVDVIHEMANRIGIKVQIKAHSWIRVIESVKDGSSDGGFSAFMTEERKEFCLYTGIIQYEQYHVFVKKGKEFSFSQLSDLYGKTIGIDRGVFVSRDFQQAVNDHKFILEEVNDMAVLNVKKLNHGRIDAMIGDYGVVPYYAKISGFEGKIISLGPIHEKQASYLILSKKSSIPNIQELQVKMTKVLNEIWEDGTYQKLMNQYFKGL